MRERAQGVCMCTRGVHGGALLATEVMAGVGAKRGPNRLLAAVMQEAAISNKGLAARVRAEADKTNLAISPDHVSVRRWLDGVRPHDDTIRCIAAALSVKLGRRVTPADIGFEAPQLVPEDDVVADAARYPAKPEQAVHVMAELTTADLSDSPLVVASGWISETAPSVITGYLFAEPLRVDEAGPIAESGAEVASRIRATVRYLMDLDFQFGGGHTRKMLLFYWKTEIVPALRQSYPEFVRREVFAAAADAAQVLGWSAYDAGRHGAAQRYFVQGLRLAREANDHMMGGRILSNLSRQANYLGNFSDAVQFARAAQAATTGKAAATVSTMFLAMEARALASIGDAPGCAEILHRAEQMFERSNAGHDPEWISYFDALELAGEAAHCFRDLGHAEQTRLSVTNAIDPVRTPPRTRAFIGMVDAAGALTAGDVDEAVTVATTAVGLAGALQSSRYLRYVADFHAALIKQHGTHPLVREFGELVRVSYPTLTLPGIVRTAANLTTARPEGSASGPGTRPRSRLTDQRSA